MLFLTYIEVIPYISILQLNILYFRESSQCQNTKVLKLFTKENNYER